MPDPTWYLGPDGDLHALICPEEGVKRPLTRYGGTHRALSGAPTVDVTGFRRSWELSLPWLSPEQARLVEALHTRTVPGPFRLIDPVSLNMLDRQAALLRPRTTAVTTDGGGMLVSTTAPPEVGVPVSVSDWSALAAGQLLTLQAVPALPEVPLTFSVHLAAGEATAQAELALVGIDASGATTALEVSTVTVDAPWQRPSITTTPPAGTVTVRATVTSVDGNPLRLAAAQLERASAPSAWLPGGGAPVVLLDAVQAASPNYPRSDVTLTLLEA